MNCKALTYWWLVLSVLNGIQMASVPQRNDADLKASIDKVQAQFAAGSKSKESNINNNANKLDTQSSDDSSDRTPGSRKSKLSDLEQEDSIRYNKMLDYFNYFHPAPALFQPYPPPYFTQNYYEDFNNIEEEDIMSRGNNRRKQASSQNSPIFYIRLPPTPYMFVPGMGYISQPPTIQPIATQFPIPQALPPPVNPFINLPINFISNGKPTNVYQWNSQSNIGNGYVGPQYPSYLPTRPHRPSYRPKPYLQDSKITHLKGPYVFNGRPEDIFILPNNPYNSFNSHYNGGYNNPPAYSNPAYNPFNTPYHAPYNSVYSDPLQNYY